MASYEVDAYGAEVRVRDTTFVLVMHAVTLGIYNLYWYYKINREMRDFGRVYRLERCAACNPWLALAAVVSPALPLVPLLVLSGDAAGVAAIAFFASLVVPIVSWYRSTRRIHEVQALLGRSRLSGAAIGFSYAGSFLLTPVGLVVPYLGQSALNEVWAAYRDIDPRTGRSPEKVGISIGALESLPRAREWDLSYLDDADLEAIGGFLAGREQQAPKARARHASELDQRIRPSVPDAPDDLEAERLLELVYAAADRERQHG